jgi:DNA helicase-4
MKVGDRVKHRSRSDCGIGRVVQIDGDNTVDVQFSNGSFSGIPFNTVISVEKLLADQELIHSIRELVAGEKNVRLVDAERLSTAKSSGKLDRAFRSIEEQIGNLLTENAGIGDYGSWRAKRGNPSYENWFSASNHFKLEIAQLKELLRLENLYPEALANGIRVELSAKCSVGQAYSIVSYVQALEELVSFVPKLDEIVFEQLSQLATQGHSTLLEELLTDPKYDWSKWISSETAGRLASKAEAYESFISGFVVIADSGSLIQLDDLFHRYAELIDLSLDEYIRCKISVIKIRIPQISLDDEQYAALASPHPATLVRARAGSGKTRTLCAKATLSIRDENLSPDQAMVVAFNKSATDEVRHRMRKDFGCPDFENARTFHSLAYQLAKPKKKLLFDEGKHPSQRAQSGFVQTLLERILNPAFKELLYQFFRKEIEEIEQLGRDLAPDEYRTFRRSLEQVSLKGGRVKSAGEKYIADFLFEHDIPYSYEKIWEWGTFEQGQPYKPDFTLVANGSDFILEHWAFDSRDRSAQLPDDWGITADQYRQQIARKRMFWANKNITLLETHCGELAGGREAFERTLRERLEDAGIRCQKLPDEEIIRRVFENNFQISRMAEQFLQFIQRAKKRCLSVDGVGELIAERRTQDQRLHLFYQLALRVYREYESELAKRGAMDFDDLLRQATDEVIRQGADARIHLGKGRFVKIGDLRWLLVDEYQDFSELYYRLLSAILEANPKIRLMAVGDDWQAINGFAGAELRFFTDFSRYFPGAGEATIATNYRSARSVVTWGNRLMNGLGPEARPREGALTGETQVVDLSKEWIEFRSGPQYEGNRIRDAVYFGDIPEGTNPGMAAQRLARALKICVRLFQQTKTGKLLLLSRTKRAYGLELGEFRNRLVGVLAAITGEDRQILRKKIRVMTGHTAKGQEEEAVVVLDASQTNFPKVHPDNLLYEIFGVTPAEVLAEEQRLFYVAITRPADTLWVLTEGDIASLYVKKLMQPVPIDRPVDATASPVAAAQPSALYRRIKERIDALPSIAKTPATKEVSVFDPWSEVVEDVIDGLKAVVQVMRTIEGTPIPKVAFDFDDSGEFVGELAWPDQVPPMVVLAGEQSEHRERWESEGWMVFPENVAIRQGGIWLADQLTLLGDLPPEKPHSPQRITVSVSKGNSGPGAETIYSRIAGLYYAIRDILPSSILSVGHELDLIRELDNRHDSFAVKIVLDGRKLGYVPSAHSRTVAQLMDNGHFMAAVVSKVGASDVEIEIRDR